jgi:hypothetical protein
MLRIGISAAYRAVSGRRASRCRLTGPDSRSPSDRQPVDKARDGAASARPLQNARIGGYPPSRTAKFAVQRRNPGSLRADANIKCCTSLWNLPT